MCLSVYVDVRVLVWVGMHVERERKKHKERRSVKKDASVFCVCKQEESGVRESK